MIDPVSRTNSLLEEVRKYFIGEKIEVWNPFPPRAVDEEVIAQAEKYVQLLDKEIFALGEKLKTLTDENNRGTMHTWSHAIVYSENIKAGLLSKQVSGPRDPAAMSLTKKPITKIKTNAPLLEADFAPSKFTEQTASRNKHFSPPAPPPSPVLRSKSPSSQPSSGHSSLTSVGSNMGSDDAI